VIVLLVSVAVAGASMGAASALIPGIIARHVPKSRGLTTGIYSAGLAMGVAIAAWLAVPSANWLGGWRPALAVWGVFAAVTTVAWLSLIPRMRRTIHDHEDTPLIQRRLPWRSRTAWFVVAYTTAIMIIGFSGLAWITPLYVELGESIDYAAGLFVLFQTVQLLAMLTLPTITDYTKDRRPLLFITLGAGALGIAFLLFFPLSMAIPAVALFGLGLGGGSTMGLILLVDYAGNQADAARLGAMTLLIAFIVGASGPLILGTLHDLTGSFSPGYAVMLVLTLITIAFLPLFRPGRSITDDEAAARA